MIKIKSKEFYHNWTKNPIIGWSFILFTIGYSMDIYVDFGRTKLDAPVYEAWIMIFNFGFNITWELSK